MNAKFKMPKLGRDQTGKGWIKELLMTFLGTTISIVLTFGSAAWIEKKEAEEARRLLAMTIVSDIDQSLEVINNRLKYEDECRGISYYLMWNCHRLEEIGSDSITAFLNYVLGSGFPRELEMETSNEHIFNSSLDSWRTLSDKKFLKNVQDFYNASCPKTDGQLIQMDYTPQLSSGYFYDLDITSGHLRLLPRRLFRSGQRIHRERLGRTALQRTERRATSGL